MKRLRLPGVLALVFLCLPACSAASGSTQPDDEPNAPASSCRGFSFNSPSAGAQLSIEIAVPEGYDDSSAQEYGSIYLLDANYFFDDAPGTLDDLLERGMGMKRIVEDLTASGAIPPSVLIGIGYTEAERVELTLSEVDAFFDFFTEELIPAVENRCQVSSSAEDRVLFGYSASAHFSTYALFHDVDTGAETFDRVISISGVYDQGRPAFQLEEEVFQELGAGALAGRRLFMAVGGEDPNVDLLNAHRAFTEKLAGRGYVDFRLTTPEYSDKGHYDIPEYAFELGLIWIFSN